MDKVGQDRKKSNIKGRPRHLQKIQMQNDLRKNFDMGMSEAYTVYKTGYAKDTVHSYFKEWTEELIDKTDFITQQQEAKVRLIESLNKTILVLNEQQEFILSKRTNKFNPALENSLTKVNHTLSRLHLDKATVLMTPTLDITLRKLIKDKWGVDIAQVEPQVIANNQQSN